MFSLIFFLKRNFDNKLAFMSKLSYTFRQRFGNVGLGIENLVEQLSDDSDVQETLSLIRQENIVSVNVLTDFTICEQIDNRSILNSRENVLIYPLLFKCLGDFLSKNVSSFILFCMILILNIIC